MVEFNVPPDREAGRNDEFPDFLSTQVRDSEYFFLDLAPQPEDAFTTTCGGLEYCRSDYIMDRKQFHYFGIEYILTGQCRLTYGDRSFDLHAGSIFCYGPETGHRIENLDKGRLTKYFVDFTGSDSESLLAGVFSGKLQPFHLTNLRFMAELFNKLLQTGKRGGPHAQRTIRLILELIVAEVKGNAVRFDSHQEQSFSTFKRCMAYLESHYEDILSVGDLAAACNVSTGYLSRVFRRYGNENPSRVILRLKLNRAAELLLLGDLLVKEVADRVGFDDPYHFSRLFKQYFGTAPKLFRESFHKS